MITKHRYHVNNDKIYFVGLNCPSKKNSKMITAQKRIISSKTVRQYEKQMEPIYIKNKALFLEATKDKDLPLYIGFYFYRDTKRKYDFVNIVQCPLDLFQKYGYIEDDDTKHVIPVYLGEEVTKKEKAGFYITIL